MKNKIVEEKKQVRRSLLFLFFEQYRRDFLFLYLNNKDLSPLPAMDVVSGFVIET